MENCRNLLRQCLKNTVVKRKLPKRFGATPMFLTPASQLKYLAFGPQSFDPELLQIAATYIEETSRVWDIGANVGVFTFAAASLAKKGAVLAIEADIWLADLIRRSKCHCANRALNITILASAVSNQFGVEKFLISNRGRAASGLAQSARKELSQHVLEEIWVPTVTLDSLLTILDKPSFIKIDVEGAEALILQASKQVLTAVRPIIYIEVGESTRLDVTSILQTHDYQLFKNTSENRLQAVDTCVFNTLAIPKEKLTGFKSCWT